MRLLSHLLRRRDGIDTSLLTWRISGRPIPPPHALKVQVVRTYAKRFRAKLFVETGTYLAEMVLATQDCFTHVNSIELGADLYRNALSRTAKYPHIVLWSGDSRTILPMVMEQLNGVCLFWLDAHYSGGVTAQAEIESPVETELRQVLESKYVEPVILIDDARFFRGMAGYPTLDQVRHIVADSKRSWLVTVRHDIIRIHRPE